MHPNTKRAVLRLHRRFWPREIARLLNVDVVEVRRVTKKELRRRREVR